jgi:hypothetical protein
MTVSPPTFISRMLAELGLHTWPDADEPRYPSLQERELAQAPVAAVLLSTEPYRFGKADRESLRRLFKRHHAHSQVPAFFSVDGEMTSWYGSRAIRGLDYLASLRQRIDTRLRRVDPARRGS